jgi:acyl-coenzyme A thioesterase PaaI-like protein
MHLGDKLNGWPHVVHGGVQSFIMDEIMAFLVNINNRVSGARVLASSTVTAELKVRFVKTMKTPSVVCVTARLKEFEGRKLFTESVVTDEHGTALASAEALFLTVEPGHHGQKL